MSIDTSIFVQDTATISINKCLSDDGWTQEKDSWDIVITNDKGDTVTLYCFGDNAVLTADLTGEGV